MIETTADPGRLVYRGRAVSGLRYGVKCRLCGDQIESRHRHDLRYCSCQKVAVDGGRDYLRIVGKPDAYDVVLVDPVPMPWSTTRTRIG